MRKLILGILTLSLMLMMIGSVSAAMGFTSITGLNTDTVHVVWSNPSPYTSLSLQWKEGSCSGEGWYNMIPEFVTSSPGSYDWNVLGRIDGIYCLRFQTGETTLTNSGLFTIDRNAPTVEANGPYTCDEGSSVLFVSTGTSDSGSGIESYEWIVNGVSQVVSSNPTYDYVCGDDNVYGVTLIVTDYAGNSASDDSTVTINEVAPIADFTWTPTNPTEGQIVHFTDDSSSDYDAIVSWSWDFDNDGISDSALQNPTYTYIDDELYPVTLTVTDDDSSVDTVSHDITVTNIIPVITNLPASRNTVVNTAFTFDVDATDSDTLIYGFESAPAWMSIDPVTGIISGTPDTTGSYVAEVSVYDGTDTVYGILTVTVYDYQIILDEGKWNLISLPLVPEEDDTSIASVFSQFDDTVGLTATVWSYAYDENTGENIWTYNTYAEGLWDADENLQNIIPGYGYYVEVSEDQTIYLNGEQFYETLGIPMPPSVTLAMDSWNLIGTYGLEYQTTDDALTSLIVGGNHYYDVVYGNAPFTATNGYWVSIKKVFQQIDHVEYKAAYAP